MTYVIGQLQNLENTDPPAVTDASAPFTSLWFMHGFANLESECRMTRIQPKIIRGELPLGFATFAELTYQALRNHGAQSRFEQKTFHTKIEKARHRRRRGFGVKGREDEMAGQRRVNGDMIWGCGPIKARRSIQRQGNHRQLMHLALPTHS